MDGEPTFTIDVAVLALLRCPATGRPLKMEIRGGVGVLTTDDGAVVYEIRGGIPILLPPASPTPVTSIQPKD